MNISEKRVKEIYEKFGWKVIRGGSPDFLLVKYDNNGITDCMFCEVKSEQNKSLQKNQEIYRFVLEKYLKAKYELLYVDNLRKCNICNKELVYSGIGRPPKYCKDCAYDVKKKKDIDWRRKHFSNQPLPDDAFSVHNEAYTKPDYIKYNINYFFDDYRKCPECDCDNFDFDTINGEIICQKCGLILGELLF